MFHSAGTPVRVFASTALAPGSPLRRNPGLVFGYRERPRCEREEAMKRSRGWLMAGAIVTSAALVLTGCANNTESSGPGYQHDRGEAKQGR